MVLDIGAGPRSAADVQVDIFKWPQTTHVFDAMVEGWPFEDNSFEEVRMEQFLEHVPPVEHIWDGRFNKFVLLHPRIHVMKEAFRVLKHGGILHCSVPVEEKEFCQDPTHIGPMWIESTFNYFCGEWGGATPGEFVNDAYGINFAFKKKEAFRTGFILTVRLEKP